MRNAHCAMRHHHERRAPIAHCPLRTAHCVSGQVHILFVFGALALACVAFLVFNTGEISARRVRLQNGADATAHAAATWTARGLNLVSANNVAITQLIAMAVLIDSLDVYCDLAPNVAEVQQAACERLKWANWPPLVFDGHRYSQRAVREERFLEVLGEIVDEMVATFHPTQPDDAESLWQMMYMLEAFSDAVVETTPLTAAERAVTMGRSHGGDGAFAWPYLTPLPLTKGSWQDLEDPTDTGSRCPGPTRPQFGYQVMYGDYYRHTPNYQDDEGVWHAWNVGPLRHLRHRLNYMLRTAGGDDLGDWRHGYSHNAAAHFISLTGIANTKFRLLFDGRETADFRYEEQFAQYPPPPEAERSVWWDEDMHSTQGTPDLICQPSDYPDYVTGSPGTPLQSGWHLVEQTFGRRSHARDWTPADLQFPDHPPFHPVPNAEHAWEQYFPFTSTLYPEFGVGEYRPWPGPHIHGPETTFYHQWRLIYSHSTRTRTITFHNPIHGRDELPRPHRIDDSWSGMTDAQMRDECAWLGFAWRSGESTVWPRWFINTVPGGQMVAVARARLYNPTSWDLFTQDWRVMMLPVGSMDDWLNGTAGLPDPALLGDIVTADDVEPVRRFFQAVPPDLHDALMTH